LNNPISTVNEHYETCDRNMLTNRLQISRFMSASLVRLWLMMWP